MKHEAIIKLYPSVKSVVGEDLPVAYDANGDVVSWDADDVAAKEKELLDAYKLGYLRHERNLKLTETDWVITMHKELGTNIPASWKTYRQELRDITKTYNSIEDDGFKWPSAPSE